MSNKSRNRSLGHTESLRQGPLGDATLRVERSQLCYLNSEKLCRPTSFTRTTPMASLGVPISSIVRRCPKEQMIRPYTNSHIAMMAYEKAGRDRAEMENPRETVSTYVAFAMSAAQLPVARRTDGPSPHPAWAKFGTVRWDSTFYVGVLPEPDCLGVGPAISLTLPTTKTPASGSQL